MYIFWLPWYVAVVFIVGIVFTILWIVHCLTLRLVEENRDTLSWTVVFVPNKWYIFVLFFLYLALMMTSVIYVYSLWQIDIKEWYILLAQTKILWMLVGWFCWAMFLKYIIASICTYKELASFMETWKIWKRMTISIVLIALVEVLAIVPWMMAFKVLGVWS